MRRDNRRRFRRTLAELRDEFHALSERAAALADELREDEGTVGETSRARLVMSAALAAQAGAQLEQAIDKLPSS